MSTSTITIPSDSNLTGQEIADIAYSYSGIKSTNVGQASEVLIYFFLIVCTIIICLRIWVRTFRAESKLKWGLPDYLAVLGFLPYIPAAVFGILAAHYGIGATDDHLNSIEGGEFIRIRGMEYLMYYELTYFSASTITKYAIAATILTICTEKRFIYPIWGVMILMAVAAAASRHPIRKLCAILGLLEHKASANGFLILSYVGTSAQILVDWTCAIMPFFIVYRLQMPRRAKISVVGVLGLGVLASVAALMRIISYQYIDTRRYPDNHMLAEGRLLLWSILESSFAIIACSLPSLKKLFTSCIGRSFNRSGDASRSKRTYGNQTPLQSLPGIHTTSVTGNKWDRLHDDMDDSSTHQIMRRTDIHIETDSNQSFTKTGAMV
uniref:Rhodopsin domain-containing protein n=1 Tax=Bionectria ochroleuca TaxID=29856 RepID=A0A8H7NCL9_BIOOC